MTSPNSMEYLSGRARANRWHQVAAADSYAALAHGEMADMYQRRFSQARADQTAARMRPDDDEGFSTDDAGEDDGSTEVDGSDDHLHDDQKSTTK